MSAAPPPAPPTPASPRPAPPRAIPPLVPILLPLVVTAIALSIAFSRWFPPLAPGLELPPVRFNDVTEESGLTFVHFAGHIDPPTTLGAGVAVIDFDRDGHPDLFFVNGTHWPWEDEARGSASAPTSALFRNDGSGRFTDVSRSAGVDLVRQGMSVAVGDFDRDGWPDIYVTAVGRNVLLRNRGDGRFVDVTDAAGVGGGEETWSTGAAWLDADGDGWLDLAVCHYVRWPREIELELAFKIAGVGRSYGAPAGFVSVSPSLYRNLGDGRFVDVTNEAGLRNLDPQTGLPRALPLAVAPVEANGDARLDLLFTFQTSDEVLFLNQGDGTFREWLPVTDRRREGAAGLAATGAFSLAPEVSDGDRFATMRTAMAERPGSDPGTVDLNRKLGFALWDYTLSGEPAVLFGHARMEPEVNRFERGQPFGARPAVSALRQERWLSAPMPELGDGGVSAPLLVRGLAVGDFDGDGDEDLVITQHGGRARLWRNDQRSGAPWLRVQLASSRSAPGAGGAQVEVHTPRRVHVQTATGAVGFFAQSDPTLTFGLGDDGRVRRVVVRWPGGARQEVQPVSVNQTIRVAEPP